MDEESECPPPRGPLWRSRRVASQELPLVVPRGTGGCKLHSDTAQPCPAPVGLARAAPSSGRGGMWGHGPLAALRLRSSWRVPSVVASLPGAWVGDHSGRALVSVGCRQPLGSRAPVGVREWLRSFVSISSELLWPCRPLGWTSVESPSLGLVSETQMLLKATLGMSARGPVVLLQAAERRQVPCRPLWRAGPLLGSGQP